MAKSITCLTIGAPTAASQHHPGAAAATAISTTYRPQPRQEDGPAAWTDADRAGVLNAENHEPLTEASAASVGQPGATIAPAFPDVKFEMTQAARLALLGWELRRAELGGGYIVTRWDRDAEALADLAAVTTFADHLAGRTDGGGAT